MPVFEKPAPLDVAGVIKLMEGMLTPESFERWRAAFPDSRIQEFIDEYDEYDSSIGWEDEVRDDPDNQNYVVSEEYWEEHFADSRGAKWIRHGDSDSDSIVGFEEKPELSEWDLEPEELESFYGTGFDSSLNSSTVQNARVEQTPQGTWVVRGDTERFGKDAILYEDHKKQRAVRYLHKLNKSESAKNMAKSRHKADLNSAVGSANLPKEFEYQLMDYNRMLQFSQFREAAMELKRLCEEAHTVIPDIYVSGMSQARAAGKNILFENDKGVFRWDESKKQFVPLNSSKGNMRIRASVNCARHQHAITCLNCAVSEVTVPTDFVRTESRAFDLMMIVQNELWDRGMDVTIKQLYRPQSDTFRFSYIITDPTTTDEQVDAAIEEIVGKLVQTGFIPAEAYGDLGLNSDFWHGGFSQEYMENTLKDYPKDPRERTAVVMRFPKAFPQKSLWSCTFWLDNKMKEAGWEDCEVANRYRPYPRKLVYEILHPESITAAEVTELVKRGVSEFIQAGYPKVAAPEAQGANENPNNSEGGQETTDISINMFDKFPSKKLWECMNWLEHEMWAEGWNASIERADQPKPDQITLTVSHPSSVSDEDIDDFVKDRVLEFIENGYERFVYPDSDPRSRYNASLSCSVDWVSGDGNAFYLVDDGEDDGWGEFKDYEVETDEYGNDVVHYEGYVITGNERIGYVALSPYGKWSPNIYRSITDAVDDVDRDIATKSQARA